MLGGRNSDAKEMIALAFQQMAENAQKIGELNISPDLLTAQTRPALAGASAGVPEGEYTPLP
jgi:hypothetical protein